MVTYQFAKRHAAVFVKIKSDEGIAKLIEEQVEELDGKKHSES